MLFYIKLSILIIVICFTKLCCHGSSVMRIIGRILGGKRLEEQPNLNLLVMNYFGACDSFRINF